MKIRTDFVTNSSSSSFLVFDVKHPKLFDLLESMGVHIDNEDKRFTNSITVKLDSGEELELWMDEADWFPACSESMSITIWLLTVLLSEVESLYPAKELDEYSDFTIKFLSLLNEKGYTNIDIEDAEAIDRANLELQLCEHFAHMDNDIEEASVEFNTGFEGEIIHLEYIVAKNGYKLFITANDDTEVSTNLKDIHFVFVGDEDSFDDKGQIEESIKNLNGVVLPEFSEDVDCIICNDVEANKEIIDKANELCIPIISEKGMLYRYVYRDEETRANSNDLDDEEDIYGSLFECTYDGDFENMFYEYGIGLVTRRKSDGTCKEW